MSQTTNRFVTYRIERRNGQILRDLFDGEFSSILAPSVGFKKIIYGLILLG
jgi:hypothetical protein